MTMNLEAARGGSGFTSARRIPLTCTTSQRIASGGPVAVPGEFAGYLQADAFSGYDGIYTGSGGQILEVACWAHARRKFYEARSSSPAEAR